MADIWLWMVAVSAWVISIYTNFKSRAGWRVLADMIHDMKVYTKVLMVLDKWRKTFLNPDPLADVDEETETTEKSKESDPTEEAPTEEGLATIPEEQVPALPEDVEEDTDNE